MLFAPSVEEIYPSLEKGHWDYGILSSSLEGKFRPGHFDGVLTVVKRLFEIVTPQISFFGEKDFQQLAHIKRFTREEMPDIEIVGCATLREPDGLAMSSRNMRLNEEERKTALHISRVLHDMCEKKNDFSPAELEQYGRTQLELVPGLELEYLEIVDESTFAPVPEWSEPFQPIILAAAYVGEVRLIDNIKLVTRD
jgi:pantoate--beta-alanine ligase